MNATDENQDRYAGEGFVTSKPISNLPVRGCPACEATDQRRLGVKNDLSIVSCHRCGTMYTPYQPWYTDEAFYSGYYPVISCDPEFVKRRLAETVKSFAPFRATNRLLDVGCGTGGLLQAAASASWHVEGIDVSNKAAEHVKNLGFEVFCGTLEKAQFPDNSFDVVTASELLEHVPSPRLLVGEIARILRPGGLFWTTTPHARGISGRLLGLKWSVLSPPEHLQLFSVAGARKLLSGVGFRILTVRTEATNPYELWHRLRTNSGRSTKENITFDRVETSYQLNETLMKSPFRVALKAVANEILNVSRLGDSLKIQALR
jgi:2-polyprenyl-3-methyl-5-hydroxy-6-metoxy-1,4-benzoquinol methylase